jgi:hypothetical protein
MTDACHVAGPYIGGVQRCSRCGEVLVDGRCESGTVWEARGLPEGSVVAVRDDGRAEPARADRLPWCGAAN